MKSRVTNQPVQLCQCHARHLCPAVQGWWWQCLASALQSSAPDAAAEVQAYTPEQQALTVHDLLLLLAAVAVEAVHLWLLLL